MAHLIRLTFFLISIFHIVGANPFCDNNRYGSPHSTDCVLALSQMMPSHDKAVRFFVEEQLRTSPQSPVWAGFVDSRPASQHEDIIQLPKWTSSGTCNVALYSFRHGAQVNAASPARWFRVFEQGMQINTACITGQGKGGAAVVMDERNRPGLGIYMWADGALFQEVVNQEMGDMFPYGMDPTIINDDPMDLQLKIQNQTLPKELKGGSGSGFVEDLSPV